MSSILSATGEGAKSRYRVARKLGCVLALTLIFGLCGGAIQAQDAAHISLDHVDGLLEAGKLSVGEVTFHIRYTTPATNAYNYNISNGWRLY